MGFTETVFKGYLTTRALSLVAVERLRTGLIYAPGSRQNLVDPYPMYKALRERDPFHRSYVVDGWVATRYADLMEILRDSRFSSDDRNLRAWDRNQKMLMRLGALNEEDDMNPSMLRLDPPDHTRLRSLVSKAFTPRAIEKLRGRAEAIVDELISKMTGSRSEIIASVAYPLPVIMISDMLGIPSEDRAKFKHWSDEVVRSMGMSSIDDFKRSRVAWRELRAYLKEAAEERRRDPQDDLLSALLMAEEAGDKLSTDEVFETLNLLLVAGNETTTNLIGNGVLALLRSPDQLEALRADPDLIESGLEEILRYDSPVQATARIALEPVEMHGCTVRPGQQVILSIGAANRDPERFENPDTLDLSRKENRHLSFSQGPHFCLGAQLARLEGRIALGALVQRFPELRLDPDHEPEPASNTILRGPKILPVLH